MQKKNKDKSGQGECGGSKPLPPRTKWNCFWGIPGAIGALVFVLDQWTKWLVASNCELGWSKDVIPGYFNLVHVRNTGAAWGMFSEHTWLLGVLSVTCLVLLVVFFDKITARERLSSLCFGALAGGIAGNMVDRLFRKSVVDFLDFHWHEVYHYPSFNVADIAICVSMFLVIAWSFWQGIRESRAKDGTGKAKAGGA